MQDDRGHPSPIFILSMPRSGSTLLQRILATHPAIATVGEPHFLVPLLYALRRDGVYAEYNHEFTSGAIHDFLEHLPEGEASYDHATADFARQMYAAAARNGETFFVDKAPRYALIASDLLRAFPDAHFIVLWRNPLAVAASLMETYHGGAWRLHRVDDHLYLGLRRLLDVVAGNPERIHQVRYEEMVTDPAGTVEGVAAHLGLDLPDFDLAAAATVQLRGTVGDKMGAAKYTGISSAGVDAWTRTFANPLRTAWADGYLRWIGSDGLSLMGYDGREIRNALRSNGTSWDRLGSDAVLMPYSWAHRRLDPPQWRARTQDSMWRYVNAVSGPLRSLGRSRRETARSGRPERHRTAGRKDDTVMSPKRRTAAG